MKAHFQRGKYRYEDGIIGPSLDTIERTYNLLLACGDNDSVSFFKLEDHDTALKSGQLDLACWHLFWDMYNWLKFFWWTSAFKARQLAESLVHSYNTDNHISWLILARSTLEYGSITYYFGKKIKQLSLQGPDFAISQLNAFEELMLQYSHGSRFDWSALMSGDRDRLRKKFDPSGSAKAINVLTAMNHLARRDARYKDVEAAYDMLSDFAHPNMASHAAVAEMPGPPGPTHEVRLAAYPTALRGEFLMVVSLPWVSIGLSTMAEVLVDLGPLLERWLSYVDQEGKISIDLSK